MAARPSSSKAPVPNDEPQRLAALRAFDILRTAEEDIYDQITEAAAEACKAPIALISLVDSDQLWFKSHYGVPWRSIDRCDSFCTYTILDSDILIVPDTLTDERFRDNPYVTGSEHVRFYAGIPLRTAEGHAVGALCVVDRQPRKLTEMQKMVLRDLSRSAMRMLHLTRHQKSSLFAAAVNLGSDAVAISDATEAVPSILYVNRSFTEITGCPFHEAVGKPFFFPCSPEVGDRLAEALSAGRPEVLDCQVQVGSRVVQESVTFVPYLREDGKVIYCVAIHRDRTAEKQAEEQRLQLHAMQTTMRSINHVVLNFMNTAALYRRQMEGKLDAGTLVQFDMALENARAQLTSLASMHEFKERKTPFGFTMLDPEK